MDCCPITRNLSAIREIFPEGSSCELSRIAFEEAERIQGRFESLFHGCGGQFSGIEFRHATDQKWVAIFPEMSAQTGLYRIQQFDARGFSGHSVYSTELEALEEVARDGYVHIDRGILDQLSQSDAWKKGLVFTDLIRQVNSGQISSAEYYQQSALLNAA